MASRSAGPPTFAPVHATVEATPIACCASLTNGEVDANDAQRLARMFRALGDPTRIRLLSIIAAQPDGEACVCDLTDPVGLAQPTVSHHMKQLVEAGLVVREQRGRWAYFTVNTARLDELGEILHTGRSR